MDRNKTVAIAAAAIVIGSIGFVALWYPTTVPDVRIGYLSQDLHQLALKVAVENGWFEDAGIKVELTQYGNGAYEMDGFFAGQIDMGYLGAAPALVKSINQETMITILAAVNLEGSAIMVDKTEFDEGRVTTIADLAGKTVRYPGPSTVQAFLLRMALNQSGMTIEDINAVSTSPTYMEDLLSQDAPAFIAWEPFAAKAEGSGAAVVLMQSGEIWPDHPCCVLASSNSFLAANPEIVEAVVEIHHRAENWIIANPTNATEIAIDWLEMDDAVVESAFNNIIYDFQVNRTGIQMYLEYLIYEEEVEMELTEVESFLDGFINTTIIDAIA
ncbi:MAG: ABC transporter substrate-binding protein [Candidatus Thorarchaeota archaeon]